MAEPFGMVPGYIEDRRDNPDMSPEWRNVSGSLGAIATQMGNYFWGVPQIPEAPDTLLSDALGKRDIRLIPQVGSRSPLDSVIDEASDALSLFLPPGSKLGSDVPFTQRQFSPGVSMADIAKLFGNQVGFLRR